MFNFAVPGATYKENGQKFRPAQRRTTHGQLRRRIIREVTCPEPAVSMMGQPTTADYEYSYHTTQGWRRTRITR